ncbi:hypothetical protein NLU13_4816 [Sarocladium strictum]|uniref:Methyltransferase n=1 Tax=Sarocladium strictum TaxID=5046 RepID=A0AA39GKZ6_SARSR|nr:hypothetical protein NLU13_4816 [Sarocladium strictum]
MQPPAPGSPATAAAAEAAAVETTSGSPSVPAEAVTTPPPQNPSEPATITTDVLAVEEADDIDDGDSALGESDNASSTASVSSSVLQFRLENGRTYHGYKESIGYVLPNDRSEQERLDLQHNLFLLTLRGQLYKSPIDEGSKPIRRCLDAGTGTGVWAMDFADEHPEVEVLGIDVSPIQPNFVPPNVSFVVDDLEEEWNYNYKFDFIFARMLTGSISDWPRLFAQSFEFLEPGGWMECQDISLPGHSDDGTLKDDSLTQEWARNMLEAASRFGRYADSARHYKKQMQDAGFVNVTELIYKWPMNRWPADPHYKELGFWNNQNMVNDLSGLSMALFNRGLGWSPEEIEVFLVKVRAEMNDRNIHTWWPIHVVYGQKPEDAV